MPALTYPVRRLRIRQRIGGDLRQLHRTRGHELQDAVEVFALARGVGLQ